LNAHYWLKNNNFFNGDAKNQFPVEDKKSIANIISWKICLSKNEHYFQEYLKRKTLIVVVIQGDSSFTAGGKMT
jgi:hypothetical protein